MPVLMPAANVIDVVTAQATFPESNPFGCEFALAEGAVALSIAISVTERGDATEMENSSECIDLASLPTSPLPPSPDNADIQW